MADLDPSSDPSSASVGFDALYGLQVVSASPDEVRAQVIVGPEHLQPFGLVHGGLLATLAESTTSVGTWLGVRDRGMVAMGQSNQTSFLRPIVAGRIHVRAWPRHRGRTTWVWDVEITDDDDRLCATTRMTIAVRPAPTSAPAPNA